MELWDCRAQILSMIGKRHRHCLAGSAAHARLARIPTPAQPEWIHYKTLQALWQQTRAWRLRAMNTARGQWRGRARVMCGRGVWGQATQRNQSADVACGNVRVGGRAARSWMDRMDSEGVTQMKCTGGRGRCHQGRCAQMQLHHRQAPAAPGKRDGGLHALVQARLRVSCMPCPVHSGASAPPQQGKAMRRAPNGPP